MKKIITLSLLLLLCTFLTAQASITDKKNFRLPGGYINVVFAESDITKKIFLYIADTGAVTPINDKLYPWIMAKGFSIEVCYPGDRLVWTNNIDEQEEQGIDNGSPATMLRAANNKTGEIVVLDSCAENNDMVIIDLSPDGQHILYKVFYETYCIFKVTDWKGLKTEFPYYKEFDTYNRLFWLNNEEILIQDINGLLLWNLRLKKVTPLLKNKDLASLSDCSPDGKLLFCIPDEMNGIYDITTGQIQSIPYIHNGYYEWSSDGKSLYSFEWDEERNLTLSNFDPMTGTSRPLHTWSSFFYSVGFLKADTALLFAINDDTYGPYSFFLYNLQTGQETNFSEEVGYYWYGQMACPHLYFSDGDNWILDSEVLGLCDRKSKEGIDRKSVPKEWIVNNKLTIRISESLYETTWLDSVSLMVAGARLNSENIPEELEFTDAHYLSLRRGQYVDLCFTIPNDVMGELLLEFTGYYEPGL